MRSLSFALAACVPLAAFGQPKTPALPDGPGKEQVQQLCSGCHGLNRVMNSGYPQAYWHTVVRMMINFGVPIPPDQVLPVTDYLAKNLPEKAKPDANIVSGAAKVAIRECRCRFPAPGRTTRSRRATAPSGTRDR